MSGLPSSLSYGHDNIDALAFKSSIPNLLRPVQHIVNLSLRESRCALKWKFAAISPRLKSQGLDRHDISLYRPVSVLPTISKIVERTTQKQLLDFLETTNQMNPSAHAYRRHLSMTKTLADITDKLYQ